MEAHLSPQWQRTIVPSLLRVGNALGIDCKVQIIATTHSPLVLASMEPHFDQDLDAWFAMSIEDGAELRKREYIRQGEVGNWLVDAFDIKEPRSLEGEKAVLAATALLGAGNPHLSDIDDADKMLRGAGLPDIDPFWVRWRYFVDRARESQS